MMGHREKLKTASEYDVIYARGIYCYTVNTSAPRKVKKQMMRRNRRKDNRELRDAADTQST